MDLHLIMVVLHVEWSCNHWGKAAMSLDDVAKQADDSLGTLLEIPQYLIASPFFLS